MQAPRYLPFKKPDHYFSSTALDSLELLSTNLTVLCIGKLFFFLFALYSLVMILSHARVSQVGSSLLELTSARSVSNLLKLLCFISVTLKREQICE